MKQKRNSKGQFTKGSAPHNKGKKATPDQKKKIREAVNRPDVKRKLSESKKGKKNPMYGKSGNAGSWKKGNMPWNKGLTKEISEIVREMGEKQKGRRVSHSQETIQKMRGHTPWNKGKILVLIEKQRKRRLEYQKKRREEKYDEIKKKRDAKRLEIKSDVFSHYSKKLSNSTTPCCNCCGENKFLIFLTIDHITGWKNYDEGPKRLVGKEMYRFLQKNNYPTGYQVLCMNCNSAKSDKGICPHQRSKK
jgi:hypothetical protein